MSNWPILLVSLLLEAFWAFPYCLYYIYLIYLYICVEIWISLYLYIYKICLYLPYVKEVEGTVRGCSEFMWV